MAQFGEGERAEGLRPRLGERTPSALLNGPPQGERGYHHTFTRFSGARYIFCPGCTLKAEYHGSWFRTVHAR